MRRPVKRHLDSPPLTGVQGRPAGADKPASSRALALERELHHVPSMRWPALLIAGVLGGCHVDAPELDERDERIAIESASAESSHHDLMKMANAIGVSEDAAAVPSDEVLARIFSDARLGVMASVESPTCLTIDSDESTYIDVQYDDCQQRWGIAILNGGWRAEIGLETEPCDAGECLRAGSFGFAIDEFTVSGPGGRVWAETSGSFRVRDPVDPAEFSTYEADTSFTNAEGSTLASSLDASWLVDDASCYYLDFDGQLSLSDGDDLGVIASSGRGIVRCPDACPSEGTIRLSYGAGAILQWSYDGSPEVVVSGPRGSEAVVALPCGDES